MRDAIPASRLLLRRPIAADAGPMGFWAARRDVAEMTALPHPYPAGAAESFIRKAADPRHPEDAYVIDGAPSGGERFLGLVGLRGFDGDAERRLGFWVAPHVWGSGYATEATTALLAEAFDAAGLETAIATVYVDNPASRRVLDKLGFAVSREGRDFNVARGALVPQLEMRLPRAEFARRRVALAAAAE